MTPLQTAAQAAIKQCEADAIWAAYPWVGAKLIELSKALADEQAQAVEPTITTKTEQVAGAISKHISTPLVQREVLAAAQYIVHRYIPAQPVQQVAVPAPMTEEHIYELAKRITKEDAAPFEEVAARPGWAGFIEIVRAIEAHHGIGAKP